MEKSTLITGGARSGKSALAERLTLSATGRGVYIATAQAFDDEMKSRIAAHQDRRGPEWQNVSEPLDLCGALTNTDGGDPRLVDCLTLWLTNLMLGDHDWRAAGAELTKTLRHQTAPVVFVTNEVGCGIVPENKLARQFRDAAGWLNQTVAEACDHVYLCAAGYPIRVKPNDNPF
ncbi:bifunctional adenosylcobinamide kinase/adenosylcobinamide-phosphate guanylyltransferase [Tropicibacter naphthalenivorans]|uniref:Bifunctional adenosylcobalamin biosynthesis protein n=1 Tax=Tropicibacter naphthalenivorans TaxID=441103 RepID=A0A0N7M0M1_9RHOB|nr:bifunctional adenosylcobinamide kinase/adenosylcobinamide-phosphate guanylyltransferase [Tropicibacter naphthalenivorans]CUH80849.1 Adenosylcobinamide kinase [Tropicibacter naphthalenivorans]SMC90589.1 adenosylcobinamide kinase /adenosylcobinamide-phosphate guanylyltransferase [Tropicibacter naphthalenivorans]